MEIGVWSAFFLVALFQLVMSVCMAFADGDDAYYIPISETTAASGSMYRTIPYTGETTILDVRHGLAPFPIWIAFISKVSRVPATILAQSILGGVLLLVCYSIYHAVAEVLFKDKKAGIPYFMLFVSLLFLFGNYSFYSAETFLMTRTSQGKAVLANLVIPFLFWCLLQLAEEGKNKKVLYLLLLLGSMASWLCSTLGTFLCAALFGIAGFVLAIREKNWKVFAKLMLCALPSMAFALFYYFLQ